MRARGALLTAAAAAALLLAAAAAWRAAQSVRGAPGCEMTWMYARYEPVEIVSSVSRSDLRSRQSGPRSAPPRYRLLLYREDGGPVRQPALAPPPARGGHPVLFIPGNAGSYQQVRSIAAETAREWARRRRRRAGGDGGDGGGDGGDGKDLDW